MPLSSACRRFFSTRTYSRSLQHREGGGVGGGPADAELLHALHQRRLGIARRRLGEVLGGGDPALLQRIAGLHRRQAAGLLVVAVVVLALLVEAQEAVELHHLAGGAQVELACRPRRRRCRRWCAQLGRLHLAGDGADPDQLVEPRLLGLEGAARPARGGGPCRSGGRPRAPPGRSSAWSRICAARRGRSGRRIPCR